LGDAPQGAEYSENEFLYWTTANAKHDADWKPPTQHLEMIYSEWLEKANLMDDRLLMPGMPHYYLKLLVVPVQQKDILHQDRVPFCKVVNMFHI
jgi:hypothetical protein